MPPSEKRPGPPPAAPDPDLDPAILRAVAALERDLAAAPAVPDAALLRRIDEIADLFLAEAAREAAGRGRED